MGAAVATLVCYALVAVLVAAVDIPPDVPTAQSPWFRPFRVIATMGFAIASSVHLPHVIGQFLAAIVLGSVLGAVFATVRYWLQ
jgi:hypothetical protein